MKYLKERTDIILITLTLGWVFWTALLPGVKIANDYHFLFPVDAKALLNWPFAWRNTMTAEGLGEYSAITLWSWPLNLVYGIFSNLGFEYSLITRVVGVLPILIVGAFGINFLLEYFSLKRSARVIGTVFYLINSYILLIIDGGQLNLGLAYAMLPLVFLFYRKFIDSGFKKDILFFLLANLLVSVADIRILFFVFWLILFDSIFEILLAKRDRNKKILNYIFLGLVTGLFLAGFHSYWLLPSLLSKSVELPSTYGRESQVGFLSFANLGLAFFDLAPHWPKNIFGSISPLRVEFGLIPILVFLAPILRRKDRWVGYWLLIALFSVFLAKGSNPPGEGVYPWIFSHVPGFSLFRDPSKFYFLICLAYSVLLAISMDKLLDLFPKKELGLRLKKGFLVVVLLLLVLLAYPVWTNKMTGLLSTADFVKEYESLTRLVSADKDFSRILWIPIIPPLGYASTDHPGVEASRLAQKRPFAIGTKGSYETFNFIREAPFMGELFDVAGIKYIVYPPPDPKRAVLKPDNYVYYFRFLDQITHLTWIKGLDKSFQLPVLETKEHQDHLFLASNLWWVIGSDNIYNESTKSAVLKLAKNAMVFADEYPGLSNKLDDYPGAKIILNKKIELDLAASFIGKNNLIFPAGGLDFSPDKSGWWKREAADLISWRDFLQTKYGIDNQDFDLGGGWAVSEGSNRLYLPNKNMIKGQRILIRVFESTRSGEIRVYGDRQKIAKVKTQNEKNNVRWFDLGRLKQDTKGLTIETTGDINVVNALAVLPDQDWQKFLGTAQKLEKDGKISEFKDENALQDNRKVEFREINPTKYAVKVTGLSHPQVLIFSESYDPLWKINDQGSFPVFSLLNGFLIEKDGVYIVEYSAQKWVAPGLFLSFSTLLIIIVFLFST